MFQDDRMISFLTAIIVLVAIGTVLQRADGISSLFEASGPKIVLREDTLIAEVDRLRRIDVLKNDAGIEASQRRTLKIVKEPACGKTFVQGDVVQYLPSAACRGSQTIHYSFDGVPEGVVGVITARVQSASGTGTGQGEDSGEDTVAQNQAGQDAPTPDADNRIAVTGPAAAPKVTPAQPATPAKRKLAGITGDDTIQVSEDDESLLDALARGGSTPAGAVEARQPVRSAPAGDETRIARAARRVEPTTPAPLGAVAPGPDRADTPIAGAKEPQPKPLRLAATNPALPVDEATVTPGLAVVPQGTQRGDTHPVSKPPKALPGLEPAAPRVKVQTTRPLGGDAGQPETPVASGGVRAALPGALPDPGPSLRQPKLREPEPEPEKERLAMVLSDVDPAPRGTYEPRAPKTRFVTTPTGSFDTKGTVERGIRRKDKGAVVQAPADAGPQRLMLAQIPRQAPRSVPPASLRVRMGLDRSAPLVAGDAKDGVTVQGQENKAPAPARAGPELAAVDTGPSRALAVSPVDRSQEPPAKREGVLGAPGLPTTVVPPVPPERKLAALDPDAGGSGAARRALQRPKKVLRKPDPSCTTVPSTELSVNQAAETTVIVVAPCHANTVAELQYADLKLAVVLDAQGRGVIVALGFEPTSTAALVFDTGEKIDFDIPFKGANRVSRVALVWDYPVKLELNALEFGAPIGSANHISLNNPKSFRDVRRKGGGYLLTYPARGAYGQNVQVYSYWHKRGGAFGAVRLLIDYASRNRDQLAGTCGDGAYAAPRFKVMLSSDGRRARPVMRQLAALPCSQVALETGDNRLISGAVPDLVINR